MGIRISRYFLKHYRDLIGAILKVMGLPVPPEYKFSSKPYYLDGMIPLNLRLC